MPELAISFATKHHRNFETIASCLTGPAWLSPIFAWHPACCHVRCASHPNNIIYAKCKHNNIVSIWAVATFRCMLLGWPKCDIIKPQRARIWQNTQWHCASMGRPFVKLAHAFIYVLRGRGQWNGSGVSDFGSACHRFVRRMNRLHGRMSTVQ